LYISHRSGHRSTDALTPTIGELMDTVMVLQDPPVQSDRGDQSSQVWAAPPLRVARIRPFHSRQGSFRPIVANRFSEY